MNSRADGDTPPTAPHRMLAPLRSGLIGAGLSLASLPVHFVIVHALSVEIAALVLALVAGIYVGFAVQDGRVSNLIVEGIVAIAFIGAALAGLVAFAWAIPLAYALHGVWDMAHHRLVDTALPRWYVPFCAVFDWVFAAGLAAAWTIR